MIRCIQQNTTPKKKKERKKEKLYFILFLIVLLVFVLIFTYLELAPHQLHPPTEKNSVKQILNNGENRWQLIYTKERRIIVDGSWQFPNYSQTCVKRPPIEQGKSGLYVEVDFGYRF